MTDAWRSIKHARRSSSPIRRHRAATGIVRACYFRPGFESLEDRTLLSTFVVNNTADSGPGSLRQGIVDSNANPGPNTIDFDIPGTGVQAIAPVSSLPAISNPVLIDGTSQPGYGGTPLIELSGSQAGGGDGLTITGAGVTVRGLDINNFNGGTGIHITGTSATGDWIYGNFLGTDPTGTQAGPNYAGVEIDAGAVNNLIGTNGDGVNDAAERNLLSGNLFDGVWITGQGTDGNAVAGNFIGTDISGSVALNNGTQPLGDSQGNYFGGGVAISAGTSGNRIGTDGRSVEDVGERNAIAGSDNDAIDIWGTGTDGNIVAGNFIGTDVTGTRSLGIAGDGGFLAEGASFNWIGVNPNGGTAVAYEGNVISGNGYDGIHMVDSGTDDNVVAGDRIGTDVTGTLALGDSANGVEVDPGSADNTIGDAASGSGNVISANGASGVWINGDGATGNLVQGNKIGTDVTGTVALGNSYWGVVLQEAANNMVGGAAAGAGNLVSGNHQGGVAIRGIDAVGDVIQGNLIGTDLTGTQALGNAYSGVYVGDWGVSGDAASDATIGGTTAEAGNVISANGNWGVWITGGRTTGVVVQGNKIGTDVTGTVALGNAYAGVQIDTGASENTIGGAASGAGNLITDNGGAGVVVGNTASDTTVGDKITANRIYANTGQAIDLGDDGVTYNSTTPRQGPNNLQNFAVVISTTDGQYEGWLGGSLPEATFRIDVFASAAYGPGGSGEAQDYLGSLEVTTGATGQASFAVPFTAPAGLPIITATATDPQGNTSEVSSPLPGGFQAQSEGVRLAPGQESLAFSPASGDNIDLQDSVAGSSGPTWELMLFVSSGTVTLSSTAGLVGSGDQTGSLVYSGTLSALNAAMDGMTYTPLAGFQGNASLSVQAESDGIALLAGQVIITTGSFVVTTTADSGPGSLRQAILDSNTATGGSNTIDFAIPGTGVQTIALSSPLPPITTSVLIDGTTQPGFAGTPVIALASPSPGNSGPLAISGGTVTIRGLAVDSLAIDATADELLIAVVQPQRLTTQLSLLDSQGHLLVQGEGVTSDIPDNVIDEHLMAGNYSLGVNRSGGQATYTLTTMLVPSTAPFQGIPIGSAAAAVVAGDFNGDGHLDLAVAGEDYSTYTGEVSVLLGNGDGTFQPAQSYSVGSFPDSIVAGDFSGDGRLDLAVANEYDNDVSILLGNGDGTFQPEVTYAVGSSPDSIVAGDFTSDGRLDLAVSDGDGIQILLGNGDGTFQPATTVAVGTEGALVAGDFSGDGRTDLAVAGTYFNPVTNNLFGQVSLLLSNGDGTFQPAQQYAVALNPDSIVAGDFNGDGRLDLAVAGYDQSTDAGEVSVLLGNGDGTFQPAQEYALGAQFVDVPEVLNSIVAGDFNGDGRLGLAVANPYANDVSILSGNGDGTFEPAVQYAVGSQPESIVAGDFSGDGRTDLAVANYLDHDVSVLLGNGDRTFQSTQQNVVPSPRSIVAGDFNGDGQLDIAVADWASNDVSVLLGNGDGTFEPAVQYAVGSNPDFIVAGDFNGDGRLDLAVSDSDGVQILLGNGDGTFQPARTVAVGTEGALVAGDFAGDGRLDLAVADGGSNEVSVLLGNGDRTFQPAVQYAAGLYPDAIVAGDFGTGHISLAVADSQGNDVSVLLGNGDGTFQPVQQYAVGSNPDSIVTGDFTGDGRLDLAVADLGPASE